MSPPKIHIIRTGVANLASVVAGFKRLGAEPVITESAEDVAAASHVMLPGVGAFGAAMEQLRLRGLDASLKQRFAENRRTVCICVGLQVLAQTSDETPGATGLKILPVHVNRFPGSVRVPQLGWNELKLQGSGEARFLADGFAYFANSYYISEAPAGWTAAKAHHGTEFVAGLERGNWLALQFHPELSGPFGESVLRRWLETEHA